MEHLHRMQVTFGHISESFQKSITVRKKEHHHLITYETNNNNAFPLTPLFICVCVCACVSLPSVSGTRCLTVAGALSLRVSGLLRVLRCFFSLCFTFRLGSDANNSERHLGVLLYAIIRHYYFPNLTRLNVFGEKWTWMDMYCMCYTHKKNNRSYYIQQAWLMFDHTHGQNT